MSEAVKNTEHELVSIDIELDAELADRPMVMAQALGYSFYQFGEMNKRVASFDSVIIEDSPQSGSVIATVWLNTCDSEEEQDCTAIRQEIATKISEALKSRKE